MMKARIGKKFLQQPQQHMKYLTIDDGSNLFILFIFSIFSASIIRVFEIIKNLSGFDKFIQIEINKIEVKQ